MSTLAEFDTPLYISWSEKRQDSCTTTKRNCGGGVNKPLYDAGELLGYIAAKQSTNASVPLYANWGATVNNTCTYKISQCGGSGVLYPSQGQLLGYISATYFDGSLPLYYGLSSTNYDSCTSTSQVCGARNYPRMGQILGYIKAPGATTLPKIRVFPTPGHWTFGAKDRSDLCNGVLGVTDCTATEDDFKAYVTAKIYADDNYDDLRRTATYTCKSSGCRADQNPDPTYPFCQNIVPPEGSEYIDSFKVNVSGTSDPKVSKPSNMSLTLLNHECGSWLIQGKKGYRTWSIPQEVPRIDDYDFIGAGGAMDDDVTGAAVTISTAFPKPYATSPEFLAKCCTATAGDAATYCPTDYQGNTPLCDDLMTKWCTTHKDDPKCGCFYPKPPTGLTPTERAQIPQRCWPSCTTVGAYATAGMGSCDVNYNICKALIKGGDLSGTTIKQDCDQKIAKGPAAPNGPPNGNGVPKKGLPTWVWFAVGGGILLIVMIVLIIL